MFLHNHLRNLTYVYGVYLPLTKLIEMLKIIYPDLIDWSQCWSPINTNVLSLEEQKRIQQFISELNTELNTKLTSIGVFYIQTYQQNDLMKITNFYTDYSVCLGFEFGRSLVTYECVSEELMYTGHTYPSTPETKQQDKDNYERLSKIYKPPLPAHFTVPDLLKSVEQFNDFNKTHNLNLTPEVCTIVEFEDPDGVSYCY